MIGTRQPAQETCDARQLKHGYISFRGLHPNGAEANEIAARTDCRVPIIRFPLRRSRRMVRRSGKKQYLADGTTIQCINR